MVKIKNQLVSGRARISDGTNTQSSITVHETGNRSRGADAQAHADLQSNYVLQGVSWHIQVDDRQAIRSYPNSARCWHSGSTAGNNGSVAVEICVNADGDYQQALRNAAEVVQQLRAELKLQRSEVLQHNRWNGKNCPEQLRGSGEWEAWLATTDPGSDTKTTTGKAPGKTTGQLAAEVIDGKHGTGQARRAALGSRYDAVQAEVNRRLQPQRKTTAQLASEVIDGKHGTGQARRAALGSRYDAVQAEVNRRLQQPQRSSRSTTVGQAARQIVNGTGGWGNEPQRSRRLQAAGLDAAAVQREVNRLMR